MSSQALGFNKLEADRLCSCTQERESDSLHLLIDWVGTTDLVGIATVYNYKRMCGSRCARQWNSFCLLGGWSNPSHSKDKLDCNTGSFQL